MSNNISLLADLRAGKNCSLEAAAAIEQLEATIEQQASKIAMLRDWFKKDNSCTCETCWSCAGKGAAVLSQSSDTWLAAHDAEVRRKVLEEVYKEVNCGIRHVRWALEIIRRRMAEQPDALRNPAGPY